MNAPLNIIKSEEEPVKGRTLANTLLADAYMRYALLKHMHAGTQIIPIPEKFKKS